MIIKSKFSDYYDGGLIYGIDSERYYIREKREFVKFDIPKGLNNFEIIGFCGEIYPIVNKTSKGYGSEWYRHPKDYVLFEQDAIEFDFVQLNSYRGYSTEYKKVKIEKKHYGESRESIFNNLKNSKLLKNFFIKYNTPIFHIGIKDYNQLTLTINPCLSDFAFYRIKDTVQAFQEIEMFIGNVLVKTDDKPQPVGSDLDILLSKGFDAKTSFRKEKQ